MAKKIHCDLLETYGPDWANMTEAQANCVAETIHTVDELFGQEPDLYGFVGTQRLDSIVGGFLALQYATDEFHYDRRKHLQIRQNAPFSRMLFVVFASKGKVLLQNTKFAGIPLNMHVAWERFRSALNKVLSRCGLPSAIDIYPASEDVPERDFVTEFERSTRVARLVVTDLTSTRIPPDFMYYNPERERDSIIRGSHVHDYDRLKKVDLTAKPDADLRDIHMRDMLYAAVPVYMEYSVDEEERRLRREAPPKLEFYFDMSAPQVTREGLAQVVELVRRERPTYIDLPTPLEPRPQQPSLFDALEEDEEDE